MLFAFNPTMQTAVACLVLFAGKTAASPRPLGRNARVVNGVDADIANYPWVAQLHMTSKTEAANAFDSQCGGALIAPTWILTAAHCLEGLHADPGRVYLGTSDNCNPGDAKECVGGTAVDIKKMIIHSNYSTCTMRNDIGLIELERDVSDIAAPVDISNVAIAADAELSAAAKAVVALGWGALETDGASPAHLKKVFLDLKTVEVITNTMTNPNAPEPLSSGMIGAYADNKDTCQGDSGGPLLEVAGNKLVGIVSFGGDCNTPNSPGIYSDVGFYYDWIAGHVDGFTKLNGEHDAAGDLGAQNLDETSCPSSGMSTGALVGIIVGSVVGLILIIVIVVICCKKNNKTTAG